MHTMVRLAAVPIAVVMVACTSSDDSAPDPSTAGQGGSGHADGTRGGSEGGGEGGRAGAETYICDGPNPAGCAQTGCGVGLVCDPNLGCHPTHCDCGSLGVWACWDDCRGGECVAP